MDGNRLSDYLDEVGPEVVTWPTLWILATSILVWKLRGFLVASLGDVSLYVAADEKSDLHEARATILRESASFLTWLLEKYPVVYVAGHSLGSVIAYDTLNQLQRDARVQPPNDALKSFKNLQGLFTFGSPLDKIDYFFRVRVGASQKVRGQLLASLHGLRRASTSRDYKPYEFEPYLIPRPTGFWWANYHAPLDPVSGRLDRYMPDEQCRMPYRGLWVHSRYLKDEAFFDRVYSRL